MAYQNGIATSYIDLLTKVKNFATANGWTALRDSGSELILRGAGLAGTDEIYVGIQLYANAPGDAYGWNLQGYTSYNGSLAFDGQPGAIAAPNAGISLLPGAMSYWLVVNARRILLVVKVSTVYQAMYLGFFLPYATPGQYPYPLLVAGSLPGPSPVRWSDTSNNHAHVVAPKASVSGQNSGALLRQANGQWLQLRSTNTYPYTVLNAQYLLPALDGGYVLEPVKLITTTDILGELDGCYHLSGFQQSAENTVEIGADTYLVVQNVFRTGPTDYWALKLA